MTADNQKKKKKKHTKRFLTIMPWNHAIGCCSSVLEGPLFAPTESDTKREEDVLTLAFFQQFIYKIRNWENFCSATMQFRNVPLIVFY